MNLWATYILRKHEMQNCEKKRVKKEEYVVSEEIQMLKFKLHTPTLTFIVIYRIVLWPHSHLPLGQNLYCPLKFQKALVCIRFHWTKRSSSLGSHQFLYSHSLASQHSKRKSFSRNIWGWKASLVLYSTMMRIWSS